MPANTYEFEKEQTNFRSREDARTELPKLARRLKLDLDGRIARGFKTHLEDLIIHCHLAIQWYQRKIKKMVWLRRVYFAVSLGLLLVIPATVLLFGRVGAASGLDVSAQLTAVLTGLFAFQRGLSAWLDKRQIVASYAKAAAELKELLYDFEQKWEVKELNQKSADEFEYDLHNAVQSARQITTAEAQFHFENLAFPSLDLGSMLKAASADAASLVTSHTPTALKQLRQKREAEQQSVLKQNLIAQYRQQLIEREAEYEAIKNTANAAKLQQLSQEIARIESQLRAAELEAAAARAEAESIRLQ